MSTTPLKPTTNADRLIALVSSQVTADHVVDRLSTELGLETDTELAKTLGVSKTTVSSWRKRNSIPFEAVVYYGLAGLIDIDYVLTGRNRLKSFITRSESLDEGDIEREIIETALAEILMTNYKASDAKAAADQFVELRDFYKNYLKEVHSTTVKNLPHLSGRYTDFAARLMRMIREKARERKHDLRDAKAGDQ